MYGGCPLCPLYPLLVQDIDLSELIHVLQSVSIVTSEHTTIFVVINFLIAKVSPEYRWNPGLDPEKVVLLAE